jgi:hypothetical protein
MTASPPDAAIDILRLTRDGEDLDPKHLKLVELAVNGMLNETGLHLFRELHAQVQKGYVKPWFHGVENITRNHEGYILWRGKPIEHFSCKYAVSDEAATYVKELARRCAILESHGITPDTTHVVWRWNDDQ